MTRLLGRRALSTKTALSGEGSLAVVLGGFGFTPRQLTKHESLYREHGFDVMPVLSSIPQLISPTIAWKRGPELAARVQEANVPIALHTVSGSFWTAIFMLAHLDPAWREANVKAIMFDSCPPKSDIYAFGGCARARCQSIVSLPSGPLTPLPVAC